MSETDAVVVRDHDEQGSGAGGDLGREALQFAVAEFFCVGRSFGERDAGDLGANLRVLRQRAGDAQSGRFGLGAKLLQGEEQIHAGAQGDDEGHRGELEQQGARGEPWSGRRRPRHRASPVALRAICAEPTLRAQRKGMRDTAP